MPDKSQIQRGSGRFEGSPRGDDKASSIPATTSPRELVDDPEVVPSNTTVSDTKKWESREVLGAPGQKFHTAVYPNDS